MALRWRPLLDEIGVSWSDRGRNVAHGWIALRCPFCGNSDPSQHLGINEEEGHWRCLRNEQHRGRAPFYLLHALGVRYGDQMTELVEAHGGVANRAASADRIERVERTVRSDSIATTEWRSFTPAADDPDALDYLRRRHFLDPVLTAQRFDLRVGRNRWARRIWFPLHDLSGQLAGFTGRALDPWLQPRYYTQSAVAHLYLPRQPRREHRLAVLVEGPFDALKIADATERYKHLLVVALCGLSVIGPRREQLAQLAQSTPDFVVALDAAVWLTHARRLMAEMRAIPLLRSIRRLSLPPDIDDPGAMTRNEVERWLSNTSNTSPNGLAR